MRRYALSTLVNALLENEKPIPFEFLINGTFLRTSIDEYLTAYGISSETVLDVEYVRAIIPPLYVASFEHDDWVSSVDVLSGTSPASRWSPPSLQCAQGQERVLSASYDGLLRVWTNSSNVTATSPGSALGGHTAPVKSARFISPHHLASSGLDRTIRVWKYTEDSSSFTATITPQIELYGHKASVDRIDVHQPSSRILSASADHSVGLWSSRKSDSPPAPTSLTPQANPRSVKRQKLSASTSTPQRGPLALLKSHTAPVSAAIFAPSDPTVAYSSSWDHTLKTWDLPTGTVVDTRTTSHSLLSLAVLPELNLVAVGTSARHITLIDPRASAATVSAMTLRGHVNAVVGLAREPDGRFGLVSASHDGTCRIWDVRARKTGVSGIEGESVFTIARESAGQDRRRVAGEGVKVFGVVWDAEIGIASVGEDKRIQINRGKGVVGGHRDQASDAKDSKT